MRLPSATGRNQVAMLLRELGGNDPPHSTSGSELLAAGPTVGMLRP
jgi:hypothetical protein